MRLMLTSAFAALALTGALAGTPALAGNEITLRVSYDDLDLTRYDAVNELKSRIAVAAEEACAPSSDWVLSTGVHADCEATLRRKALAEVEALAAAASAQP